MAEKHVSERSWTLEQAVKFCQELRSRVEPIGFSVGLTGSALYRGTSSKDIDVILYPLKSPSPFDVQSLRVALVDSGMISCIKDRAAMRDNWRYNGILDEKWVEVWDYNGKRVDLFFMT